MADLHFIGIGAARSGTSWLHNTLKEHPRISFGLQKELNFFNDTYASYSAHILPKNFTKGLDWYLRQLVLEEDKINGEISPTYFTDENAPSRIKQLFPHVKILVILRNPIDRAYSHYRLFRSGPGISSPPDFDVAVHEYPDFRDGGLYFKHLSRYYELFPAEQIGVFLYDDLERNPEKLLRDVERFLGVNEFIPGNIHERVNQPHSPYPVSIEWGITQIRKLRRIPVVCKLLDTSTFLYLRDSLNQCLNSKRSVLQVKPPDEETVLHLKDFFSQDVKKLEPLIKRDLSMWLQNEP